MDWIAHFDEFFTQRADHMGIILDAAGCREGWVQGEMFLHGRNLALQTNATPSRFDLSCSDPAMIAEIKVCGGDYSPKMKGLIRNDVKKLAHATGDSQRFMILVVDRRLSDTALGRWLTKGCDFPCIHKHDMFLSDVVAVRMWQIPKEAAT